MLIEYFGQLTEVRTLDLHIFNFSANDRGRDDHGRDHDHDRGHGHGGDDDGLEL